jgi:dTMP kinase
MGKGKFLVIDGTDGSGKATQTKLLVERLRRAGCPVRTVSFPRYGMPSTVPIENYLAGKFGTAAEVGPYRASTLYADDRKAAAPDITGWLESGEHVIADRYVMANIGHQGGKITDPDERRRFIDWLIDLEYVENAIPRPDLNVILHVPPELTLSLMADRPSRDIHEQDLSHLRAAEASYLLAAAQIPGTILIECAPHGEILSREAIHELIWAKVASIVTD